MTPLDIEWSRPAEKDLRRLEPRVAERIRAADGRLAETGEGDVRKPEGRRGELALRVGEWRVLFRFDFAASIVRVARALPRGRAYAR